MSSHAVPGLDGKLLTRGVHGDARGGTRHLGAALLLIATAQLMVVLDATVVYVALPHIQRALGFSSAGLEWVVNAYALTFGGLLLLGGRAGDLLGRRRMFVVGLLLCSAASFGGGFATSQAWLLAARAVQGVGGAIVAPAALSLIATTFPEGPPRNRAMGVYAAMSGVGSAVGLLAGGLLVTYVSWRWVLFVNVPIGIAAALGALGVLAETPRLPGRFDLPGAVTGTVGIAALVYGLSTAAPASGGASHWGDANVVAALTAGGLLLAAFAVTEARSGHALLPVRVLRDRDRLGANLIMLGVGTAIFGVFFFVNLFAQDVWGYSALKAGVAFLPLTVALLAGSAAAARLVSRIGARPLLLAGATASAGGMYWLSRVTEHSTYANGLLGPSLIIGAGVGLLFAHPPHRDRRDTHPPVGPYRRRATLTYWAARTAGTTSQASRSACWRVPGPVRVKLKAVNPMAAKARTCSVMAAGGPAISAGPPVARSPIWVCM
jgi:EmrB/QacA subfamily drug resistance transporter